MNHGFQAFAAALIFCMAGGSAAAGQDKPPGKAADKPTLIVFDIVAEKDVKKGAANLLTEIAIDRLAGLRRYEVIGRKDLDKLVMWEQDKQLKGCTETGCLVQVAGAMGARFFVEGSVGVMGEKYILTLKLMDVEKVKVLERATEQVRKDEEYLVKAVERMVDGIMGAAGSEPAAAGDKAGPEVVPVVEKKVETGLPGAGYRLAGKAGVFGGMGVAALGGVFTYLASRSADEQKDAASPDAMKSSSERRELYNKFAVGSYVTGGVLAAGGAVLWWVARAGPGAGSRGVMLLPEPGENSFQVVLRGMW